MATQIDVDSQGNEYPLSLASKEDLEALLLRREAANANGTTSLNNDDANNGFSALTTETDTNSAGGLKTDNQAGKPAVVEMYLGHKVNANDGVRILLMNNGTTKRAYLLKDKAVPLTRQDVDPNDELWNKKEILDEIAAAVAGISTGLKIPISLALESSLPNPSTAAEGDYYRISNMDVSAPGHSGEAWFNPEVAVNAWQKTVNVAFTPDGETLDYDPNTGVVKVSDLSMINVEADTDDFGTTVSGTFHALLLTIVEKIRGLFSLTDVAQETADAAVPKAGGAMTGTLADPAAAQVRNIQYSLTDLTASTSALTTGSVYFVYE